MPAVVDKEKCEGCGDCAGACASEAIKIVNGKAVVDADACCDCGACVDACPKQGIEIV